VRAVRARKASKCTMCPALIKPGQKILPDFAVASGYFMHVGCLRKKETATT
jgi:hypothetical protein